LAISEDCVALFDALSLCFLFIDGTLSVLYSVASAGVIYLSSGGGRVESGRRAAGTRKPTFLYQIDNDVTMTMKRGILLLL
jgi:hypothetical protein